MKSLLLSLIFCFACTSSLQAAVFSVPVRVNQGHAFPVYVADSAPFTAHFRWRGESLAVNAVKSHDVWRAEILLGVPVDAAKNLSLSVTMHGQKHEFSIIPMKTTWAQSILKVAPKYVSPPPDVQKKIRQDVQHSRKAMAVRSEKKWSLPLMRPVPYGVTGPFGSRRVFNGQPRSHHKGTDLRSPAGTAVKATADGVVLLAENQYYGGNMVYLDHGQGVISTYAHLSAFYVTPGERVHKGQILGISGATGRVTGPHLHFGLLVQGVAVDAMPLLQTDASAAKPFPEKSFGKKQY